MVVKLWLKMCQWAKKWVEVMSSKLVIVDTPPESVAVWKKHRASIRWIGTNLPPSRKLRGIVAVCSWIKGNAWNWSWFVASKRSMSSVSSLDATPMLLGRLPDRLFAPPIIQITTGVLTLNKWDLIPILADSQQLLSENMYCKTIANASQQD